MEKQSGSTDATVNALANVSIHSALDGNQQHIMKDQDPITNKHIVDEQATAKPTITDLNRTTSPFLRLPAELRTQIYEYALCNRTIHIGIRRRQPLEEGGYPREIGVPLKLMHTLCLCTRSFNETYSMSICPEPDVHANFDFKGLIRPEAHSNPDILHGYYTDHKPCNSILHDLQWREYMSFPGKTCKCPFPCFHYFKYRQSMVETYGDAAQGGLEKKYGATKFHLSLLQVCKQIHKEAALLPYSGNTFAFQNRIDMDFFLDTVLFQEQRDAVETVNICIRSLMNPTLPKILPKGLKKLECYVVSDDSNGWNEISPWKGKFDNVQVVSGWDGRRPIFEESREVRRRKAERVERFLMQVQSVDSPSQRQG